MRDEMMIELLFSGLDYRRFRLVSKEKSEHRMLWLQLAGIRWGPAPGKSVNTNIVTNGLIMTEGTEIIEI